MDVARSLSCRTCILEVRCDFAAVREGCRQARAFLAGAGLAEAELDAWELALAEAANNAVQHTAAALRILPLRIDLLVAPEWVEVRINDQTPGFDYPDQATLPPEDSESGRGLFLIQSLTDEAHYLRGRGGNCLALRKRRAVAAALPVEVTEELLEARRTLELMTEELASSYESLSAIFRFSAELQGNATSEAFIHHWLSQLLMITEADWFVLRLADRAPLELRMAATSARNWQARQICLKTDGPEGNFAEVRAAVQRNDVWFDKNSPLSPEDPLGGLAGEGCGFAHPLFVNEVLVGVLSVGRQDPTHEFASGQVSVVQTFSDFLGLQIRSKQLQEEQVRSQLNARDLEIAAGIQRALLPAQLPWLPQAVLTGFYRSAREIGGDYYDALPMEDGHVLLVVADVMGKGLPAALFAFMFRSLVRARRDLAHRPGELLAWLNRNLFQELDRAEMFITAQLVFLDGVRGHLRVSSAGHPPLLVASPAGAVTELSVGGPPLGILPDAIFEEECHASTGGRALMFTDGLIEARNHQGQLLGLEVVKSELAAAARAGESSEVVRDRFTRLLQEFEQGTAPADDTAFLVIANHAINEHG